MTPSNIGTGVGKGEVRVAEQDGFATRTVGPDGESVRIQVKAGDALPHDAELEGGGKTSNQPASAKLRNQAREGAGKGSSAAKGDDKKD